jgi:hypothetical protein
MGLYWVSLIIQDAENSKPWLSAMSSGCVNLKEAMEAIERGRDNYRVLCAWIDTFDENNHKSTVFHECYVDAIGNVDRL